MNVSDKKPSVREQFVSELERQILSGELKVGQQLPPARQLCTLMGVSLTVVNAGVAELVKKGLLRVNPRHGTYVADYKKNGNIETFAAVMRFNGGKFDDHEIRSFCETRIALDPFVVDLVAERCDDEKLSELLEPLKQLEKSETADEACDGITAFLSVLYSLSDNTILALLYNSTIEPQKGMYRMFIEKNGTDILKENCRQVYDALINHEPETAKKLLIGGQHAALEGEYAIISNK